MGEDQDSAGAGGLDEADGGDGLAGAGGVLEPEAPPLAGILHVRLGGGALLGLLGRVPVERLLVRQLIALVIDKQANIAHLKWILEEFCKAFFEVDQVKMRFRPSFFPFTEPSAEVDIQCSRQGGEIRFGEGNDWLEILGCGMVHPNVLRNCGLDPDEFQGFAWGMGIDRIAMLKYGMPDLRPFFEADVRWLNHYGFRPLDIPSLVSGLTS